MLIYSYEHTTMHVNYLLVCEYVTQDEHNRVDLVRVFNAVHAKKLPTAPKRFVVALSVNVKKEDVRNSSIDIKVEIRKPDGSIHAKAEGKPKNIPNSGGTIAAPIDMSGKLAFEKKGEYKIKLFVNGEEIAETGFNVGVTK